MHLSEKKPRKISEHTIARVEHGKSRGEEYLEKRFNYLSRKDFFLVSLVE